MISKTGLKPYHMNRLQEAQQQLIAEAPGLTRGVGVYSTCPGVQDGNSG